MKFKCERCHEIHDNNDTPQGGSFCDDCLTIDDIFPDEEYDEDTEY